MRFNGAIFHEVWNSFQFSTLGTSGLTYIQNAGDAEIDGIETDITWAPIRGLMITAGGTYIDSQLTSADIPDTLVGTPLPVAPDLKLDFTGRYEFQLGNWDAFLQGGASYVGDRSIDIRQTEAELIGSLPDYWTVDIATGIERNGLRISLFVDNVFDERGIAGRYTECLLTTCLAAPVGDPSTVSITMW
ncbi:MAG: TonB-dependent receptor [Caulobacteraceae bacterium]|nr:TonB-dependent receptor [Caulobacteraceae bacterium]